MLENLRQRPPCISTQGYQCAYQNYHQPWGGGWGLGGEGMQNFQFFQLAWVADTELLASYM